MIARLLHHALLISFLGASLAAWPGIGDTIREPEWYFLNLCSVIVTVLGLLHFRMSLRALFGKIPMELWGFAAYAVLQALVLTRTPFQYEFIRNLLSILFLGAIAVSFYGAINPRHALIGLFVVTVLQLLFGVLQILRIDPVFGVRDASSAHWPVGFLGHTTLYAPFMTLLSLLWLGKKKYVLFVLCAIAVLMTQSAIGLFSFFVGLTIFIFWRKPLWWMLAPSASIALLGFIFALYSESWPFFFDNGRFIVWYRALDAVRFAVEFGYGFNSFQYEFPAYQQGLLGKNWLQAHNELVELLFDGGLFGFILFIVLLGRTWKTRHHWMHKEKTRAAGVVVAALTANALGNFTFHIAPFALYALTAWLFLVHPDHEHLS